VNGPNIDESTYPADQQYRFWRLQAEDGSVIDYRCPWWNEEQIALIPHEHRQSLSDAREGALWLGFEAMFSGTLPEYPKVVKVIAEHAGTKDSLPPWWRALHR